jgi:hypothetical protein
MAQLELARDFLRPTFKQDHGAILAGQPNPLWADILELVVDQVIGALDGDDSNRKVTLPNGMLNVERYSIDQVVQMCGNGVGQYNQQILGYPAFVKLQLADLTTNVPLYLTLPRHSNPDGSNGTRKKWNEWQRSIPVSATHAFIELNGGGSAEPGSIIARLVGDGFNVLNIKQAKAQIPATVPVI